MDEYEQYRQRILDITRDANYALWSALLTVNSVIVSVFSVVAIFRSGTDVLAVVIIASSMVSATFLIMNFRSLRNLYRCIGQLDFESVAKLTPEEESQQLDADVRKHMRCNFRETAAEVILCLQCVLIVVLISLGSLRT